MFNNVWAVTLLSRKEIQGTVKDFELEICHTAFTHLKLIWKCSSLINFNQCDKTMVQLLLSCLYTKYVFQCLFRHALVQFVSRPCL